MSNKSELIAAIISVKARIDNLENLIDAAEAILQYADPHGDLWELCATKAERYAIEIRELKAVAEELERIYGED